MNKHGGAQSLFLIMSEKKHEVIVCYFHNIIFSDLYILYFSPVTYAWEGGKLLASDPLFEKIAVTRDAYNEHGASIFLDNKYEVS